MRGPRRIAGKIKRVAKGFAAGPVTARLVPANFSIDSPLSEKVDVTELIIEGWIIPKEGSDLRGLRLSYAGEHRDIPFGLKRQDVAKAFPKEKRALNSGFFLTVETHDSRLVIEADFGAGYTTIHALDVTYSPERLVADLYNPDLAQNWAQHLNLVANKKKYFFEGQLSESYQRHADDPRLVSFYLPQFHPIEENDYVWGKGFTEWTNVTADVPRFSGHIQPILPRDTGFYDLRLEQNISDQIELAKKHGVYGFCFYYYWFSGERLLEKPLDSFLKHTEWDFNFSICWANENWTKRWDGRDNEIIVAQKYADEDPLEFIKDVEHILLDPRYIREDGKPLLTVFRASELKKPELYAKVWRDYFREHHKTELHLVSIVSFEDKDPRDYGFDAAIDFAPQSSFFKNEAFDERKYPYLDVSKKLIDKNFTGTVADYRSIALNEKTYDYFDFPIYKSVTPSWDNDARKKGKGFVMHNESPDIYAEWLNRILTAEQQTQNSPMVFINAWNEWAEGAVLEPTVHYGSAVLNRTTEVLAAHSRSKTNATTFAPWSISRKQDTKLAVVLHLYYPDRWPEMVERLRVLGSLKHDIFITLCEKDHVFVEVIKATHPNATITIVPNRGRDVLPFVHLARRLSSVGYEQVLKLHTKKSKHRTDGDDWFKEVLTNLLPSPEIVTSVAQKLSTGEADMVGPAGHLVSLKRHMGSNEAGLRQLLSKAYDPEIAKKVVSQPEKYAYFGGTMFWANLQALRPLLDLFLLPEDFEAEQGQIDGTTAHAVERALGVVVHLNTGRLHQLSKNGIVEASLLDPDQKYKYAP